MAHSNRKLKKAVRGGKTRNQEMKSKRATQQQDRLKQVLTHQKHLEETRANPVKEEVKSKGRVRKIKMWRSNTQRRAGAALRITAQIEALKTTSGDWVPQSLNRLKKELVTLKTRI